MAKTSLASREKDVVLTGTSNRYGGLFLEPSVKTELARLIERGKDAGEIRPDVDAVLVGAILAAAYFTTVQRWISIEPPPFNLRDQLNGMLDILLRGLLARPGHLNVGDAVVPESVGQPSGWRQAGGSACAR